MSESVCWSLDCWTKYLATSRYFEVESLLTIKYQSRKYLVQKLELPLTWNQFSWRRTVLNEWFWFVHFPFLQEKPLNYFWQGFLQCQLFYIYYKWTATFTDSTYWIECKLSLGIFFNWRREPLPSSLLNIGSWFHPTGCLIVIWIF